MKNYLEHETKVQFYDYILAQQTEWQWFIDIIENNFDGYCEDIKTWDDFIDNYHKVMDVYAYFVRISDKGDINVSFKKQWAHQIFLCSRLFNGQDSLESIWENLSCDFAKMLAIIVFATKLINTKNSTNYIAIPVLFVQNNLYKLFNLEDVVSFKDVIKKHLQELKINDLEKNINCFDRNVNSIEVAPDIDLIQKHKDELLNVNSFSFQHIVLPNGVSWETQYVFDMVKTKIEEDELIPFSVFNGISNPNINLWSEKILDDLIEYFNNDISSFVIETIRFVIYNIVPSNQTISYHFELLNEFLEKQPSDASFYDLSTSSLFVINKLILSKSVNQALKDKYIKDYFCNLQKFNSPQTILFFKKNKFPLSQTQNELLANHNKTLANNIYDINQPTEFIDYCRNEHVVTGLDNEKLTETIKVFNSLILEADSVILSMLFYEYMVFLLRLKANVDINKAQVKNIMIQLQKLWQQEYYTKCVNSMQTISHKCTINMSDITQLNNIFLVNPFTVVTQCMPLDDTHVLEMMQMSSEHVLGILCQNIKITKTYPKYSEKNIDGHDVDILFLKKIEKLKNEKGYKLLNYVEPRKMLDEIYSNYEQYTQINMSIFNNSKELYDKIRDKLSDYILIEYDGKDLYCAHLLQLFPILENKIREFGIYLNIVPFKEKIDEFLHMKDASNVLQQILVDAHSQTGSFDVVKDFFFIYQSMYNGNLLNIRNEACHGRDYLEGTRLTFAFKVTLFCLDMILSRIESVKNQS